MRCSTIFAAVVLSVAFPNCHAKVGERGKVQSPHLKKRPLGRRLGMSAGDESDKPKCMSQPPPPAPSPAPTPVPVPDETESPTDTPTTPEPTPMLTDQPTTPEPTPLTTDTATTPEPTPVPTVAPTTPEATPMPTEEPATPEPTQPSEPDQTPAPTESEDIELTEAPTASTPLPTPSPSGPPSSAPNETCCAVEATYSNNGEIDVAFRNCDPREDDWVGIYLCEDDEREVPYRTFARTWLWTCYDDICPEGGALSNGTLTFDDNLPDYVDFGPHIWPLPPGCYKVVLHRNDGTSPPPYGIVCEGNEFEITAIQTETILT